MSFNEIDLLSNYTDGSLSYRTGDDDTSLSGWSSSKWSNAPYIDPLADYVPEFESISMSTIHRPNPELPYQCSEQSEASLSNHDINVATQSMYWTSGSTEGLLPGTYEQMGHRQRQAAHNSIDLPNHDPVYDEVSDPNRRSTLSASSNRRFENTEKIPHIVEVPVSTPPSPNSALLPAPPQIMESRKRGSNSTQLFSPSLGSSTTRNCAGHENGALDRKPAGAKGGKRSKLSLSIKATAKPKPAKNRGGRIPCRYKCQKTFSRLHDANRHAAKSCKRRRHFRLILCPHCDKGYSREDSLYRHLANLSAAAVADMQPF